MRLHHVQVACPTGGEDEARRFFGGGLGLVEVEKPAVLAGRGGCWFRSYDDSGAVVAELHVGVEDPFTPARRAHPAFVVDDLDEVGARLRGLGFEVDESQRDSFPDHVRFDYGTPAFRTLNSEFRRWPHLVIDNTDLGADEAAERILAWLVTDQ